MYLKNTIGEKFIRTKVIEMHENYRDNWGGKIWNLGYLAFQGKYILEI